MSWSTPRSRFYSRIRQDESSSAGVAYPAATDFHVGALDRGPGDAMSHFLLARITAVSCECMIERLTIDILGVRRQM
jgi:hypothetical protein